METWQWVVATVVTAIAAGCGAFMVCALSLAKRTDEEIERWERM